MEKIYPAVTLLGGWGDLSEYEIGADGKIYRALTHPEGLSGEPDYELRGRKIYRTETHPQGWSDLPVYEIREDGKIYRTNNHPKGWGGLPDYEVVR